MDEIQVAAYSLVVRVLLVTSGLEENPGPETQNAREVEQLEDWEWSEVEYETAILQTNKQCRHNFAESNKRFLTPWPTA